MESTLKRVAVVMFYDSNAAEYGDVAFEINSRYAAHHGIDLLRFTDPGIIPEGFHAAWGKLVLLLNLISENRYEWLFWVDADAVFLPGPNGDYSMSKPLSDFIDRIDESKHLGICRDPTEGVPFNSGVFLLRNCEDSVTLLRRALEFGNDHCCKTVCTWEQTALTEIRDDCKIEYFEVNEFNMDGDLILHLAAVRPCVRRSILQILLRFIEQGVRPTEAEIAPFETSVRPSGVKAAAVLSRYMQP